MTTIDTIKRTKRILFAIAVWPLMGLLVLGCATNRSAGEQLDDRTITTKIEAKMAADPDVSAFNVDVDTQDGVVRLSGKVKRPLARDEAERIARNTKGVRNVINDIEIGEETIGERLNDGLISTRVKAKITGDSALNPFNINVDTDDGVVTLRGKVASDANRREAERLARETKGVKDVRNLLEVKTGS